jgi:hypothetical protein
LLERKKIGAGDTQESARLMAEDNARKALRFEAELRPCPTCGFYQPEMVAGSRYRCHRLVFPAFTIALFFGGLGLVLGLVLPATHLAVTTAPPWAAAAVIGIGLLAHLIIDAWNPNRSLAANREAAQLHLDAGVVELVEKGDKWMASEPPTGVACRPARQFALYALMLFALLLTSTSEVLRFTRDWPTNKDCSPIVAGPGDSVKVYLPTTITCVKGYWHAGGRAEILNADDLGVARPLQLTSNRSTWGDQINAEASEQERNDRLWGQLELPDDSKLAGQTLQIKMDLQVVYPKAKDKGFENTEENLTHTATLVLASDRYAGSMYFWCYLLGGLGGVVLALVMSGAIVLRTYFMRSKVLQTEIHVAVSNGNAS